MTENETKILDHIKQKSGIGITELEKLNISRQTLRYNLRKLCVEKQIKAIIKVNPEIKGFEMPKDEEIFFMYMSFKYECPQDIVRLIDTMCSNDSIIASSAFEEFIGLYKKTYLTDASNEDDKNEVNSWAKKIAYGFMSGLMSEKDKKEIAYELMIRAE